MNRPALARRPVTTPIDAPTHLVPTAIETDTGEVERFVAERDADLGAERMVLIREACIVVAILLCLVLLRITSV